MTPVISRKRLRKATSFAQRESSAAVALSAFIVVTLLSSQSVAAFSVSAGHIRSFQSADAIASIEQNNNFPFDRRTTSLLATTADTAEDNIIAQSSSSPMKKIRPSFEDNAKLLDQAVEARRIRQIEKDLLEQAFGSVETISAEELAREAGYDTIEACDKSLRVGIQAREQVITNNMGLVQMCMRDIFGNHYGSRNKSSKEDLIQEGCWGLARAVDRWNPEIGGQFSTYAVYWIRSALIRASTADEAVRVPEHMTQTIGKIQKAATQLGLELDGGEQQDYPEGSSSKTATTTANESAGAANYARSPADYTAEAVAAKIGLTPKQVQRALEVRHRRRRGVLSFETWMQKGRDFSTDLHASDQQPEADEGTQEYFREQLGKYLRPRELEALSWRYGLQRDYVGEAEAALFGDSHYYKGYAGGHMSFVQVGQKMQVSAEYCRRLCHKALEKLRTAAENGSIEPYGLLGSA